MSETGQGEMTVERFTGGAFAQNSYLVSCPRTRRAVLVDAGAGAVEAIRHARARGLEIEQIVLTHAHLDHVDGLAEAKRELGVPVLLHPADEPLYRSVALQAEMFGLRMEPLPPADGTLVAGDVVRFGECALEVRHAPGHAPGHVVLVGDGVALVGDCVFQGSIGRTDLPGGDFQQLMRSIRSEILTLRDETTLYPGHGPETTVGHERVSNPFLVPNYGHGGFA